MLARLASVAACALAFTVCGATTAQAATRTFVDGPGDVWNYLDIAKTVRVPNREQGDIARHDLHPRHSQRGCADRLVQLNRTGSRIEFFTRLRSNSGQAYDLFLEATGRSHYRGRAFLLTRGGNVTVKCRISHSIDYATNVAVVRLPRTCLDSPRSLQAKFGVFTFTNHRAWADNPINRGPSDRLPAYATPVRAG